MDVAFGIEVEKAVRFGMQVHKQLHGQGWEREGREQENEKRMFSHECLSEGGSGRHCSVVPESLRACVFFSVCLQVCSVPSSF